MEKLTIVKVGGAVVEDESQLSQLLANFSAIPGKKLLVHGGGRRATKVASELGIESKMINGRRITDAKMLEVVTMVYGGLVNKNLVAETGGNRLFIVHELAFQTAGDQNSIPNRERGVLLAKRDHDLVFFIRGAESLHFIQRSSRNHKAAWIHSGIFQLLAESPFLPASQKRVAAEGDHCYRFCHNKLIVNLF